MFSNKKKKKNRYLQFRGYSAITIVIIISPLSETFGFHLYFRIAFKP